VRLERRVIKLTDFMSKENMNEILGEFKRKYDELFYESTLDKFKQSTAWDFRYSLPLCNRLNNPFAFCAIAAKIIGPDFFSQYGPTAESHALSCFDSKLGVFYRWPDKGGGRVSFDEFIGMAYLSRGIARLVLDSIRHGFGCVDNEQVGAWSLKTNFYRFPWFICYLRKRANKTMWPHHRLAFAIYLVAQAFKYDPVKNRDEGGRLLSWLMLEEMSTVFGVKLASKYWHSRMKGHGPRECFETFLAEYPIFHDTSQLSFD